MEQQKKKYKCYGPTGRMLGIIELKLNFDDPRKVFLDNIDEIKQLRPGTMFIRPCKGNKGKK